MGDFPIGSSYGTVPQVTMILGARLVPARIRQARRGMPFENGKRVTQASLAEKLSVHWTTISAWERGDNSPHPDNLYALAEVTDQPLEFFFRPLADGSPPEGGGDDPAAERGDGRRAPAGVPGADRGEEGG